MQIQAELEAASVPRRQMPKCHFRNQEGVQFVRGADGFKESHRQ